MPATEAAFERIAGNPRAGLVLISDHASNRIPEEYENLGLSRRQLMRHIAWDIGAADLTLALADRLGVPAILSSVSRLVIDVNRGDDDPTLIMRLSDGAVVPGNALVDDDERQRRIDRWWQPYDQAITDAIDVAFAMGRPPALVSIHSFTPIWRGVARPWHCGILWDADRRLPDLLLERLRADPHLVVGDNEPYDGALQGDTLYRHGTRRGLAHALIEIRQDLIGEPAGVDAWVERLTPILEEVMARRDLTEPRLQGSRTGPVDVDR